jgi:hypothetical protein
MPKVLGMAVPTNLRAALLLLLASLLVVSGAWLTTSTGSPAPPPSHRDGVLIRYHGTEARGVLPLGPDRLPGAPASFRRYVKKELHRVWNLMDRAPNCKTSPEVFVHGLRTDGFAVGGEITRPRGPHCDGGGGAAYIWAIRHGKWKPVIGSQDYWPCDRLVKFGVPSEIGVHECYDGAQVVPYDHP